MLHQQLVTSRARQLLFIKMPEIQKPKITCKRQMVEMQHHSPKAVRQVPVWIG